MGTGPLMSLLMGMMGAPTHKFARPKPALRPGFEAGLVNDNVPEFLLDQTFQRSGYLGPASRDLRQAVEFGNTADGQGITVLVAATR